MAPTRDPVEGDRPIGRIDGRFLPVVMVIVLTGPISGDTPMRRSRTSRLVAGAAVKDALRTSNSDVRIDCGGQRRSRRLAGCCVLVFLRRRRTFGISQVQER